MQALERAVKVFGSEAALASAIGVADSTPAMWKKRGKVPADHCPAIERETTAVGQPVRCEELNPNVDWGVLRSKSRKRSVKRPSTTAGV